MLNNRQNALFSLLLDCKDAYITQYQISQLLPRFYRYDGEKNDFHDSKARLRIMYDLRKINADPDVPALVISNSHGVKIADEDEARAGMRSEYAAIFRKLKRTYAKERKIARDGQLAFAPNGDMTVYKIFEALSGEEETDG
jgi:hypothetical protein